MGELLILSGKILLMIFFLVVLGFIVVSSIIQGVSAIERRDYTVVIVSSMVGCVIMPVFLICVGLTLTLMGA